MSTRSTRILLVVLAIAIVAATASLLRQTDTNITAARVAVDSLRDQARTLAGSIADVRSAQVAYVARGQAEDFWMGRVSKLLPAIQQQLIDFGSKLRAPAAQAAFEPASASIENFQKLDARAQDFVRADNGLLAGDLIFSDGLEAVTTATTQL